MDCFIIKLFYSNIMSCACHTELVWDSKIYSLSKETAVI